MVGTLGTRTTTITGRAGARPCVAGAAQITAARIFVGTTVTTIGTFVICSRTPCVKTTPALVICRATTQRIRFAPHRRSRTHKIEQHKQCDKGKKHRYDERQYRFCDDIGGLPLIDIDFAIIHPLTRGGA